MPRTSGQVVTAGLTYLDIYVTQVGLTSTQTILAHIPTMLILFNCFSRLNIVASVTVFIIHTDMVTAHPHPHRQYYIALNILPTCIYIHTWVYIYSKINIKVKYSRLLAILSDTAWRAHLSMRTWLLKYPYLVPPPVCVPCQGFSPSVRLEILSMGDISCLLTELHQSIYNEISAT